MHSVLQACQCRCIQGLIVVHCTPTATLQPCILRDSSSPLAKRSHQLRRQSVQPCSCTLDDLSLVVILLHRDYRQLRCRRCRRLLQPPRPPFAAAAAASHDSVIHAFTVYCFFGSLRLQRGCPSKAMVACWVYRSSIIPLKMVTFYTQFNR